MTNAQKQLVQRFRASAADRLRRGARNLLAHTKREASAPALKELARELHTLKGESRMLGLRAISVAIHRAEDTLELGSTQAVALAQAAFEFLAQALDQLASLLAEGRDSDQDYASALTDTHQSLEQAEAALANISTGPPEKPKTPGSQSLPDIGVTDEQTAVAPPPTAFSSPSGSAAPQPKGSVVPVAAVAGILSEMAPSAASLGLDPTASAAPVRVTPRPDRQERWIQVSADRIDTLCGTIAEISSVLRTLHIRSKTQLAGDGAPSPEARSFHEDFDRCRAQLDEIESAAWALRIIQIEPQLHDLARHAKEIASTQSKRVRVSVSAGNVEIERPILDLIWEPLLHVVRNAVDHGIESPAERAPKPAEATLTLHAESVGQMVALTVSDDGRGIHRDEVIAMAVQRGLLPAGHNPLNDQQVYDLLFHHGFSTRTSVSELSGRGIGLDIVRTRVHSVGGTISMTSQPGLGTQVTLSVPIRLSKERALVFDIRDTLFAVSSRSVLEMLRLADGTVRSVVGGRSLSTRYGTLPLRSMARTLGFVDAIDEPHGLILSFGDQLIAFATAHVVGEFDLVRQPCDRLLAHISHATATASLDDGRLVLWQSAAELSRQAQDRTDESNIRVTPPTRRKVLIIDDSAVIRALMTQVIESAGYEVTTASDGLEGLDVLQRITPDVVLLDVDMPKLDGFGVLQRLRAVRPDLPVAMFTSNTSPTHRQRAEQLGANAYIVKSEFEETLLVSTISRLIGSHR